MNDVIFARTRHNYGSYQDIYRVIELSGYPIRFIDEIDWNQPITVIGIPRNIEWESIPVQKKARLIHWNIERQLAAAPKHDMASSYVPPYVDETWVSDAAIAKRTGHKYVFLGGHQAMGSTSVRDKQYDIITLMAPLARRYELFGRLKQFNNADVPGGVWGEERHKRLKQSRLMVSCHQDEAKWIEPPRFMLAGCYALPLLSENCADGGYWREYEHYYPASYADLPQVARLLLKDELRLARMAAASWRLVCVEHTFKKEVEAAL